MNPKIKPIRIEGNVAFVPLTKGYETIIDVDDLHLVNRNWSALVSFRSDGSVRCVYAYGNIPRGKSQKTIMMHRILVSADDDLDVDHIDGDGLNNRRSNLRCVTTKENCKNASKKINNTSGANGVYWRKDIQKWVAQINYNGKRKHLGVFSKIEDAMGARIEAQKGLGFTERHGT